MGGICSPNESIFEPFLKRCKTYSRYCYLMEKTKIGFKSVKKHKREKIDVFRTAGENSLKLDSETPKKILMHVILEIQMIKIGTI